MLGTNMPVPQAKCTVCTDGGCSCFTSSVCSSDSTFFFSCLLVFVFNLLRPVRTSELQDTKINSFKPQVLIQTVKIVKCSCLLDVHQCILVHDTFHVD